MGQRGPPGGPPGQPARRRGARLGRLGRDRTPARGAEAEAGCAVDAGRRRPRVGGRRCAAPQAPGHIGRRGWRDDRRHRRGHRVARAQARPASRDRDRNPQCRRRRHGPSPRAPGRSGRIGLRRLRAQSLPTRAAGHQARGRRGTGRGRRPRAGGPGRLPLRPLAHGRGPSRGLRASERLDRAHSRADGLPAGAAQAEEGGRAVGRAPAELARSGRPGRGPDCGGGLVGRLGRPQRSHRHAVDCRGRRNRCATRRSVTSASGTCWPICTSGPAISPRRGSTSSVCSAPIPRPTTWRSASGAWGPSAGPAHHDGPRPRPRPPPRPGRPPPRRADRRAAAVPAA